MPLEKSDSFECRDFKRDIKYLKGLASMLKSKYRKEGPITLGIYEIDGIYRNLMDVVDSLERYGET